MKSTVSVSTLIVYAIKKTSLKLFDFILCSTMHWFQVSLCIPLVAHNSCKKSSQQSISLAEQYHIYFMPIAWQNILFALCIIPILYTIYIFVVDISFLPI